MSSCIGLSPAISKAPVITSSPLKPQYARKTVQIEQLRKKHRKYLKKIKQQATEIDGRGVNSKEYIHSPTSAFKMESEDLALHIVARTKTKMNNPAKKRSISVVSVDKHQRKTTFHSPYVKKRALLSPISPMEETLTPPHSIEYSRRYKEVQKKLPHDNNHHYQKKHQSPYQQMPSVTNSKIKTDIASCSRSPISVDVASLSPLATTCRRKLTFADHAGTSGKNPQSNISAACNRKLQSSDYYLKTISNDIKSSPSKSTITQSKRKDPILQQKGKLISDDTRVSAAKEGEYATKMRQLEITTLKATQRNQIYALNAIMREFEEATFAEEMSKRRDQKSICTS